MGLNTIEGKRLAILAEREALIQELVLECYNSFFPDTASGLSQDNLYLLTEHTRQTATTSKATCYVAGDAQTIIEANSLITVSQTDEIFKTLEKVTIENGDIVVSSITRSGTTATVTTQSAHSLLNDEFVFINFAAQNDYNGLKQIRNVTATTFDYTIDASALTPATTTSTIIANKAFSVKCESQKNGKIEALANSLVNIGSPVAGVELCIKLFRRYSRKRC